MAQRYAKLVSMLKPKRRWAQFSLATMFVVVTVLCVWLSIVANRLKLVNVTFVDLRMDKIPSQEFTNDMLPKFAKRLAGRRMRIRGYISPNSVYALTFSSFALVEDSARDSFNYDIDEFIIVHLREPHIFGNRDLWTWIVEGSFVLEPKTVNGKVEAIYELRDAVFIENGAGSIRSSRYDGNGAKAE